MNKTHRLIWNEVRQDWIVAHEAATTGGKPASAKKRLVSALMGALTSQLTWAAAPVPTTLPTGGQVVAGQAAISQSGAAMTINQGSDKAIINWNSFSIGSQASVTFVQPASSSITLNRVLGSDPSAIYGSLKANGQVFLINPNGVLFGQGAHVDVSGMVASTLGISNDDFLAGNHRFTRDGATGSVVNQGELYGKYIALLAPEVRNEGIIAARQGTVALAAGEAVTLNIAGNSLIDVQVTKASIDTLVENKHLIRADAGTVILSAQSANQLLGQVVNSGAIDANGISSDGGAIRLLASSSVDHSGSISADAGANGKGGSVILMADLSNPKSHTTVSGSISAQGGAASGDGGFVETSGAHLTIADTAHISTHAANGKNGQWLLDPDDFTIGTDITGAALGTLLDSNNVTIQTTAGASSYDDGAGNTGAGTSGTGNGDIVVNEAVRWTADNVLSLKALRNIVFNKSVVADLGMSGSASGASVEITYGMGGSGVAYTAPTADWVTPFSSPFAAGNMFIRDMSYGVPSGQEPMTPALLIVNPVDFYFGAKGVAIYVQAASGTSVYNGSNVPLLPTFSLDSGGATPIAINAALVAGTPNWNTPFKNAGTYNGLLYASGLTSTAYDTLNAGTSAASWTVDPKPLNISVTKTYDANASFSSGFSFTGMVGVDAAPTVSGGAASVSSPNANTYTSFAANTLALSDPNYTALGGVISATIDPKAVALSATRAYDGSTTLGAGTVTITTGVGGQTLTYSGATANNAHVGGPDGNVATVDNFINAITLLNGSGLASNYQLPTLDAAHAPVTITAKTVGLTASKTYDGSTTLGANTVTITTGVAGESLGYSGATASDAHVATAGKFINAITLQNGAGGLASDYQLPALDNAHAPVTITPATLNYVADSKTMVSGAELPAFTGSVTGVAATDTLGGITTGSAVFATTATKSSAAGSYAIDGSGLTLTSTDYVLAQASGNATALSITSVQQFDSVSAALLAALNGPSGSGGSTEADLAYQNRTAKGKDALGWAQKSLALACPDCKFTGADYQDWLNGGIGKAPSLKDAWNQHYQAALDSGTGSAAATTKTINELKAMGYTATDFKDAGIDVKTLVVNTTTTTTTADKRAVSYYTDSHDGKTYKNFVTRNVTETDEVRSLAFTPKELLDAGYPKDEVDAAKSKTGSTFLSREIGPITDKGHSDGTKNFTYSASDYDYDWESSNPSYRYESRRR